MVNDDFKGALVTFDENVTHQMNVINGIAPRENVLVKALVGTLSRKIIDTIGEQTVQDHKEKVMQDVGQEWLSDGGNLDNPLLHLKEKLEKLPENSTKPTDEATMVRSRSRKGEYSHKHFVKKKFSDLPEEVRRSIQTTTIGSREGSVQRVRPKSTLRQASRSSLNFNPRQIPNTIDSNDFYTAGRSSFGNTDLLQREITFEVPEAIEETSGFQKQRTRKLEQTSKTQTGRQNLFKSAALSRAKTSNAVKEDSQTNNEYTTVDKSSAKNLWNNASPRSSASRVSVKSKFLRDIESQTKRPGMFKNSRGSLQIQDSVISQRQGSLV